MTSSPLDQWQLCRVTSATLASMQVELEHAWFREIVIESYCHGSIIYSPGWNRTGMNRSEILNNLSERERRHFEFGQKTLDKLLDEVGPIIRAAAKSNIRKPAEVGNLLNRSSIRTACGDAWTFLLVKDLLSLLYEGVIKRAPVVKQSVPASTKRLEAKELTKKDIERIRNVVLKLESNKLAAARAAQSKRARRERDSAGFKSEPVCLSLADVEKDIALLGSDSAEALGRFPINLHHTHS
jgi:hypothetical protein